jgi:hypothetical protein
LSFFFFFFFWEAAVDRPFRFPIFFLSYLFASLLTNYSLLIGIVTLWRHYYSLYGVMA